jgi:hypothetical protein
VRLASKLAAALAVFFFCLSGFGQAAPISGQAIDQNGAPLPYAQVRVCSVTSTGTPCSPTATIYYDYNLTQVAPNPGSADQYGNYTFYAPALAAPNLYVIQLSPASGVTWSYVENGPYCSLSGCTFTGPITAPYFNATQSPYYEVNGVQLASTNLLDTTNIAYINKANTFTGSPQTAPVINATTGFQNNGAAALNHVLLGNGTDYVDSATIPYSIISGGSGAGPFSGTSVPCPTDNFDSSDCTSAQIVAALNNSPTTQLSPALFSLEAVLTNPTVSGQQTVTWNADSPNAIYLANSNSGSGAFSGILMSNDVGVALMGLGSSGVPGGASDLTLDNAISGASVTLQSNGGSLVFKNSPSNTVLTLDSSNNAEFLGNVTVGGLSSGAGNCVQAGTAGILTTVSFPCAQATTFTGTSGYQTFPGGLIEQWVTGPPEGANFSGPVTISLPFTFPNACFVSSAQTTTLVASTPTGNGNAYTNYVQSCTTSTVTVWMDVGPDSVGTVSHSAQVRILGY